MGEVGRGRLSKQQMVDHCCKLLSYRTEFRIRTELKLQVSLYALEISFSSLPHGFPHQGNGNYDACCLLLPSEWLEEAIPDSLHGAVPPGPSLLAPHRLLREDKGLILFNLEKSISGHLTMVFTKNVSEITREDKKWGYGNKLQKRRPWYRRHFLPGS